MAGITGAFRSDTQRAIMPAGPPQAYKTYGMSMPLKTHWRPATCEETGCDAYRRGWVSTFDLSTDLGKRQFDYCKADKTRSFSIQRPAANLVKFVYAPGNCCFKAGDHRLPLERPARLYVAEGDWRGNPRGVPARVHQRPQDWVDDFANHQDRLAAAVQKG
jgi:hypothetical protein